MSRNVMIVDDDASIRKLVRAGLTQYGYHVQAAESGAACLDLLQSGFRGVILMDIQMPDLGGWATIRSILDRQFLEGNIICMLTGMNDPGSDSEGLETYVTDYIVKPFGIGELVHRVEQATAFLEN